MKICRSYSSSIRAKILLRQAEQKKATEDFGAPLMFDTSPESMWAQMAAQRLLWQLPPDPPSPIFSTAGAPASSGVTKFFSIFQFAPKPERGDSIQTSFSLLKLSKLSCTRDALMLDSSNALIPKQAITRSPASSRFCSISWAITWSRDRSVAGDSWERGRPGRPPRWPEQSGCQQFQQF